MKRRRKRWWHRLRNGRFRMTPTYREWTSVGVPANDNAIGLLAPTP